MNTIKQYIADGTTALFNIPFPYLDQGHVGVSLNGFPMNFGAHFEYVNGQSIRFRPHVTPVQNVLVEIKRETPIHQLLVQFQNGATLTQDDLNTAALQSLYSIEELWDRYESRFGEAAIRLSNGNFTNAQNLIDAAVASVLESQLLADLQSRISEIDLNAEAILEQTTRVNTINTTLATFGTSLDNLQDITDAHAADLEEVDTLIANETTARTSGDTALASTLSLIGAKSGDGLSFIVNLSTVKVDGTTSLGTRLTGIDTRLGTNEAAILTEQNTRVTQDSALSTQISGLSATVTNNFNTLNASIVTEQTARADGDSANASSISVVSATANAKNRTYRQTTAPATGLVVGDVWFDSDDNNKAYRWTGSAWTATDDSRIAANAAAIITEQTARADADSAIATSVTQLTARVTTNETDIATAQADIITEQTARASGDTAVSSELHLLGAQNALHTAFILNTATTMVDATTSLATRLSGIEAKADAVKTFRQASAPSSPQTGWLWIDTDSSPANQAFRWSGSAWQSIDNADIATNKAAIITEQTARASADTALANDITTVQTTVNGHTASISTQATSISGLQAQYTIKVQSVGPSGAAVIAGIGLATAPGVGSEVYILANKFAVCDPVTPTLTKVPFVITGGVCYMQNVVIQDALIENLTVGKLTSGTLTASITQNADINVGTGRIIWNNGTYMKVTGVGFGSANQFLEWFGPTMAISLCSEANAIQYLRTNGDAYFGGTLSAGTLTTKGQTSDTNANAEIVIGPFGSNGDTINVAYSCTSQRVVSNDTPPPGGSLSVPSYTIILERSVNGGAYSQVASHSLTGTSGDTQIDTQPGDPPFDWRHVQTVNGSFTFTDNLFTTQTRTYRLRRDGGGTSFVGATQTLSLIATEQ